MRGQSRGDREEIVWCDRASLACTKPKLMEGNSAKRLAILAVAAEISAVAPALDTRPEAVCPLGVGNDLRLIDTEDVVKSSDRRAGSTERIFERVVAISCIEVGDADVRQT